jgi:hypothetical protein
MRFGGSNTPYSELQPGYIKNMIMQYECAAQQIVREPQDLPDPAGSFKQKTCQMQLYSMTMYDSTGHGI